MLIYFRHGDDRGEDMYRHDRPLNERGREQAATRAHALIKEHGHPDVVYVSPFRRGLQTLEAMSSRFDRQIVIRRDPRVAQHLSEKQRRDPKLHPDTLASIVVQEGRDDFRRRVAAHVDEARHLMGRIWCITHQAVIEEVAERFDVKLKGSLGFLGHVVMCR